MSSTSRMTIGAACFFVATGCAGSSGTQTTDIGVTPMSQQVTLPSQQSIRLNTTATSVAISEPIAVGADSAYNLLLKVYADLQIPITTMDPRQRMSGNPNFKIRRRLGGVTLVKYLDCGNKDGVPNAESYDVVLNIMSAIGGATTGRSTVSTRVDAIASHPVFGSSNQLVCTTTGELEKRIAVAVKEKAGIK